MEGKKATVEKKVKKEYSKPTVRSQKVLERAALACSGTFNNPLWGTKATYSSCGYNDS